MATGYIEINLILVPLGLFGQPLSDLNNSDRIVVHFLLFVAYFVLNILFLGADEAANQASSRVCGEEAKAGPRGRGRRAPT